MNETSGDTMALAVIPKNELALLAEREGARVKRLGKVQWGFAGIAITGMALLASAPIVAPVLVAGGVVSLVGGGVTLLCAMLKQQKAETRQNKAIKARADRVTAAARIALDGAITDEMTN